MVWLPRSVLQQLYTPRPGQSFPLESKKNLRFKCLRGEGVLVSRDTDGVRGLHLDGKSIVRNGSSVEENRACESCRISGLKNACISFFCFRVNGVLPEGL